MRRGEGEVRLWGEVGHRKEAAENEKVGRSGRHVQRSD
jgi:hypothetical protein